MFIRRKGRYKCQIPTALNSKFQFDLHTFLHRFETKFPEIESHSKWRVVTQIADKFTTLESLDKEELLRFVYEEI